MVIIRLTRDSLVHAYELAYTDEEAVFQPGVFKDGVFVAETYHYLGSLRQETRIFRGLARAPAVT